MRMKSEWRDRMLAIPPAHDQNRHELFAKAEREKKRTSVVRALQEVH
jgi:hypothetical protein